LESREKQNNDDQKLPAGRDDIDEKLHGERCEGSIRISLDDQIYRFKK
jgi:hypothetical protein